MARHRDYFSQQAQKLGLRARSAFKMAEIARRFGIFQRGQVVIDLGAAPGGFLQVIVQQVGPQGVVVGIDLVDIRPLGQPNVKTAVLDVLMDDFDARLEALHPGLVDVVVSDLAPKTTGIRTTDAARSLRLASKALDVACRKCRPGAHFIAKVFMGSGFEDFRNELARHYKGVKIVRPQATRGASMEIYFVGLGFQAH